jgi:hypothetical protein
MATADVNFLKGVPPLDEYAAVADRWTVVGSALGQNPWGAVTGLSAR